MAPSEDVVDSKSSRVRFMPPERFLKASVLAVADQRRGIRSTVVAKPDRALLMSGCQDYEYSYDANFAGRANGAFTYYALKSLKTLKSTATYVDWHKAIRKSLPSQSHPQSPNLLGTAIQKKWKIFASA